MLRRVPLEALLPQGLDPGFLILDIDADVRLGLLEGLEGGQSATELLLLLGSPLAWRFGFGFRWRQPLWC